MISVIINCYCCCSYSYCHCIAIIITTIMTTVYNFGGSSSVMIAICLSIKSTIYACSFIDIMYIRGYIVSNINGLMAP